MGLIEASVSRRDLLSIAAAGAVSTVAPHGDGETRSPPARDRSLVSRLDREISSAVREADFSGVVLLARRGNSVFSRAVGAANRDFAIPNDIRTKFNLGSINKLFTAAAILRLLEQGRVKLDIPIVAYLPSYPDADIARRITIEHLLTHTSGLGSYWEAIASRAAHNYVELGDFIPLFAGVPLQSTPGEQYGYSNVGYVILGLIIEAVTARNYFEYVRTEIFRPLGMIDTESWPLDMVVPNRATGYFRDERLSGAWRSNLFIVPAYRGNSAGAGFSTAPDLTRFMTALAEDRLFSPATRANATRGRIAFSKGRRGLGFAEETINGHRIVGHSGGGAGIANEVLLFEDFGLTSVILTNGDVDGYWRLSAFIRDLLCGESPTTAPYRYTMELVRKAVSQGIGSATQFHKQAGDGVRVEAAVLEVEAGKARHRGNVEAAVQIDALAAAIATA
jgi:CubicO group peptidase (beta-lactamase class C family)